MFPSSYLRHPPIIRLTQDTTSDVAHETGAPYSDVPACYHEGHVGTTGVAEGAEVVGTTRVTFVYDRTQQPAGTTSAFARAFHAIMNCDGGNHVDGSATEVGIFTEEVVCYDSDGSVEFV